jgi:hypothetical protein
MVVTAPVIRITLRQQYAVALFLTCFFSAVGYAALSERRPLFQNSGSRKPGADLMAEVERDLLRQSQAAKSLLAALHEQGNSDDAELVADSIEGETNLVEAIDAALSEIDECEIAIVGLEKKIETFDARKKQQKDRAERIRAMIERALVEIDQMSMKLPTATISLAKRAATAVISNEADIPAKFWIEQERPAPKLDKKALTEALKAGEIVAGAALDNGTISLTVRRK